MSHQGQQEFNSSTNTYGAKNRIAGEPEADGITHPHCLQGCDTCVGQTEGLLEAKPRWSIRRVLRICQGGSRPSLYPRRKGRGWREQAVGEGSGSSSSPCLRGTSPEPVPAASAQEQGLKPISTPSPNPPFQKTFSKKRGTTDVPRRIHVSKDWLKLESSSETLGYRRNEMAL